jgi:hypothetical protein
MRKVIVSAFVLLGVSLAVPRAVFAFGLLGNCGDTSHGTGCSVDACASCVCSGDVFCCGDSWDEICVGEAAEFCSAQCLDGMVVGNCGVSDQSTELIIRGASNQSSQAADVTPKLGCSISSCEDCVCEEEAACCSKSYDSSCVAIAATICAESCLEEAGGPAGANAAQAPTLNGSMLALLTVFLAACGAIRLRSGLRASRRS